MWRGADWAGARQWGEGSHYQHWGNRAGGSTKEGWKSRGCPGEAGASGESWDSWSLACVPDDQNYTHEQNRWVDSRRTCAEEATEWATDLRSASEWVPTEVRMSTAGRCPQCMQRMEPTLSPSGAAPSTQAYPLELRKRKRRRAAPHRAQPPVATALPPVPVCSTWGTRGGCSRGKTCPMLHVNHETGKITPTRGSGTRGDGRRAWCGPTDALRRYISGLFSIAPETIVRRATGTVFARFGSGIMGLLHSFLGRSPRVPPPVEILSAPSVFRNHPDGRLLVLSVQGHRMAGECWDLQRERVFHFAPETGWPAAFPPTGAALPGQDESGGFRVWHCTSVAKGLQIMRDGCMRILPGTPQNWPQGIYAARTPLGTYDRGCQIGLRIAGVIGSKKASGRVARSSNMIPLGFIAVIQRSQEEWVCHPRGCEVVEVRFHYATLLGHLERSGLGQRLDVPVRVGPSGG